MSDIILIIGLIVGFIAGLITAFFIYKSEKKWWLALIAFIITLLAIATPLHFLIVPIVLGVMINRFLYKRLNRNWVAFLVSLLGVILIVLLLSGTGQLYFFTKSSGSSSIGGAIARGIGMAIFYLLFILIGAVSYIVATLATSINRYLKNRRRY